MRGITKQRNGQYRIGSPLLLGFSAPFIVWQMGVLYFSGTAMSLFGRTPAPLDDGTTLAVIAAGYLASILVICLLPRRMVLVQRIVLPAALLATALMLLPLPRAAIAALYYLCAFCCVFSIGAMVSIAAQHFTAETAWRDGILSMAAGGLLIAALQNDLVPVSFTAFTLLSLLLLAAQTAFYYLIPAKIEVAYAGRGEGTRIPRLLFAGIWLVSGFATLLICFASSFAESVPGGVSALYLSAAAVSVLLFLLRRRLGAGSIRVFGVFFALSVFGFVLALLSLQLRGLGTPACILLGFVVVLANLWVFFAAASFQLYATRFVGAIGAAMGLLLAAFHAGLQEALRDDLPLLYGIYAALSVALLIIYYLLEPYFARMWLRQRQPEPAACVPEPALPAPFDALSPQERTLAALILDGHTETSAAEAMHITLNTQKGYRRSLYGKLDVHTKRELFALASEKRPGDA